MATILIVDDQPATCTLLEKLVRLHGHRGVGVQSGPDALAYLEAHPADLVILDMMMPQMDGVQVLRALRADPRHHDVPVLAYSAADEFRDSALREGAQEYLLKGEFGWQRLAEAIDRHLGPGGSTGVHGHA